LCTLKKTSQSIIYPKIALSQARLTLEFITVGFSEKKLYLDSMIILLILLSLDMSQSTLLRRQTSSSVNPKPRTSHFDHICMFSIDICVQYVQLAAYVSYCVPPRELMRHTRIPTSLIVSFSTDSCARKTVGVSSDTIYSISVTLDLTIVTPDSSVAS
jgi:hypothetical protein